MKQFLKLCVAISYCMGWTFASDPPIVKSNQGSLEGLLLKSRNGNPYYAFRGIPYAEFPGRFEVAKNHASWDGIRPAKEFGSVCSQIDLFGVDTVVYTGDDMCLFLNIMTPTLDENAHLPVSFWIHGGGYASGSGDGFDGKYFVDENVIVVSINYRLGPMGFLNFGNDGESMANVGLKDQLLALKWVNKNIQAFGGDPSKVTLAGFSAGASSVHLHILSEQSTGLFQSAISHSGTALAFWAMQQNPRENAIKLASALDCPIPEKLESSVKETISCLKSKSAKEVTEAQRALREWYTYPIVTFAPVIEGKGKESFISAHPESIIRDGKYNKNVNWITGFTEDDGSIFDIPIILNKSITETLEEQWEETAPIILGYQHLPPSDKDLISQKIRRHYFDYYEIEEMTWPSLRNMFTDRYFIEPALSAVDLHSLHPEGRVFPYIFRFAGDFSSVHQIFGVEGDHGVAHGDDLQYLFPGYYGAPDYSGDTPAQIVEFSRKFVKLWASFIHTTEPIDSWEKEPFWKHYNGQKIMRIYEIAVQTGTWDEEISSRLKAVHECFPIKFASEKFAKTEL